MQSKHWTLYPDCLRQGLAIQPMLGSNYRSSCFCLLDARITGGSTLSAVGPKKHLAHSWNHLLFSSLCIKQRKEKTRPWDEQGSFYRLQHYRFRTSGLLFSRQGTGTYIKVYSSPSPFRKMEPYKKGLGRSFWIFVLTTTVQMLRMGLERDDSLVALTGPQFSSQHPHPLAQNNL